MQDAKKKNPTKEYLQQYEHSERRFKNKLLDLERLQSLATKTTSVVSGDVVSGTKNNDKMTDIINKIIDLQNEANAEIDRCINKKKEIETLLTKVENRKQRECLEKRYLYFMTWSRIAYEMGYKTDYGAIKLHGRALQTVEELLKCK